MVIRDLFFGLGAIELLILLLLIVFMNIYFTNDNTTVINSCMLSLEFYLNNHIDLLLKITILNVEHV